jgi:hypothetical protein
MAFPSLRPRLLSAVFALLAASALAAGCSLGNLNPDRCKQNADCIGTFGIGSECLNGYCSDPTKYSTDADCPSAGTCRGGFCSVGSCEGTQNGMPCFGCPPVSREEFLNACTNASCVPFDPARVTKLAPGAPLPPIP